MPIEGVGVQISPLAHTHFVCNFFPIAYIGHIQGIAIDFIPSLTFCYDEVMPKISSTKLAKNLHSNTPIPLIIRLKSHASFLFSLFIMVWGLYNIGKQLQLIFLVYPDLSAHLGDVASRSTYILLLQYTFITSITNFVTAAYGLALLIKPSRLVKFAHLVIGILILALSYYLNNSVHLSPDIIVQQVSPWMVLPWSGPIAETASCSRNLSCTRITQQRLPNKELTV